MFPLKLDSIDIDGALRLKYENIPGSLYKYRTFDKDNYSINNLLDDVIWLSNPESFNDPFDCGLTFSYKGYISDKYKESIFQSINRINSEHNNISDEEIQELKASRNFQRDAIKLLTWKDPRVSNEDKEKVFNAIMEVVKKEYDGMVSPFADHLKRSMYISCFSEEKESILMWSHYADFHRGFCIEYNFKQLDFSDIRGRMLFPVLYTEELFDATSYFMEQLKRGKINIFFGEYAAITKSLEWSYEKEWRLIIPGGVFEKACPYSVPKPKAVYLGAKVSEDNKRQMIDIANFKGIELYETYMKTNEFKLNFRKIL